MAVADQSQYGGYEYEFVGTVPVRCTCSLVCFKVCRDPHLLVCCGKHICETCLNGWIKAQEKLGQQEEQQKKTVCPHCKQENFVHVQDLSVKREIDELKIRCINCPPKDSKKEGCSWINELSTLKTHLEKECDYVEVNCPNKCKQQLKRKNLTTHTCRCQHCGKKDTYQTITKMHYDKCPSYPLDCPNKCGTRGIKRAEMGQHRSTCPLENIECSNGCKKQLLRKDMDGHLTHHCPLRKYKCQHCREEDTYQTITEKHYDVCPNYPLDCPNKCGAEGIKRAKMGQHRSKCPLEPVECPFKEAGCLAVLVRKQFDHHMTTNQQQHLLTLMGAFREAKNELSMVKTELGATKKELGATKDVLSKTKTDLEAVKTTQEVIATDVMIIHQTDQKKISDLAKLAQESIETCVQLSTQSFQLVKYGQPLTIRMINFSHHQKSDKVWYSPPFYYDNGHKMKLAVYANGTGAGAGTHVSVTLLMEGEFDHQIMWPVPSIDIRIKIIPQKRTQMTSAKAPTPVAITAALITICPECIPVNEGAKLLGIEERCCEHKIINDALLLYDSLVLKISAEDHFCKKTPFNWMMKKLVHVWQ